MFKYLILIFCTLYQNNLKAKSDIIASVRDFENKQWTKIYSTKEANIKLLIHLLEQSVTGKKIVELAKKRASELNSTLVGSIEFGEGSITDTTLVRQFSISRPDVMNYKTQSKVIINRNLMVVEALLDLAHELTHFIYRPPFNPYQKNFELKEFISATVEGQGGEVEAYLTECQVLRELFSRSIQSRFHCHNVIDPQSGQVSKLMGIKQFYRVGHYYNFFNRTLQESGIEKNLFPHVSQDEGVFISSAYDLPYPIAAIREFNQVMSRACANDQKRMNIIAESLKNNREPAAQNQYRQTLDEFKDRCGIFLTGSLTYHQQP